MAFLHSRPFIVASKNDPASSNIAQKLIENHSFIQVKDTISRDYYRHENIHLLILDKIGIYVAPEDVPNHATSIVFASKHVSATGQPALTVHATGNLGAIAKFGGQPGQISFVDPRIVKKSLQNLRQAVHEHGLNIEVTMEATHHGPTSFSVPVCFVEIGSGMAQYTDPVLGEIVSDTIMKLLNSDNLSEQPLNAVGFGGTHYSWKHTKLNFEKQYAIGHLIPKHALETGIDDTVLHHTFLKTLPDCKIAVMDWKGLKGNDRRKLVEQFEAWNIETVRT